MTLLVRPLPPIVIALVAQPVPAAVVVGFLPNNDKRNGISVLMPVRNGGEYLAAAVKSILNQASVTFELILIDDHSTDNAIAKLPSDPRLLIIRSPERGIVPALNFGFNKSRYPYIARMDGDDIALEHRLNTQLDFLLQNSDIDIAGTKVELFSDDADIADGYRRYQHWINQQCTPEQIAENFFVESCIPHPSAMMHRQVFDALGGYHDSPWPEDYDLWCRAHLAGYRFGKPDSEPLLRWRDYQQRTSRIETRYNKQQFLRCKAKYLSQQLKHQGLSDCTIWGTGPTGAKLHNYLEECGITVAGFIDVNPKLKGRKKYGKPIHLVSEHATAEELSAIEAISLIAVSAWGAREKITAAIINAGFKAQRDFILAA